MTMIFAHQSGGEPDVDYLSVSDEGNFLLFDGQSNGDGLHDVTTRCRVDPAAVNRLHAALGRWMAERGITALAAVTPPADLNPIYDAIVKRLTDEWLPRVLPLHQAPQAFTPEPDAEDGWQRIDPEPHDVGHADEPAKPHPTDWSDKLFGKPSYEGHGLKFDYCTGCGHGWNLHRYHEDQTVGCEAQLGKAKCECMRVRGEQP